MPQGEKHFLYEAILGKLQGYDHRFRDNAREYALETIFKAAQKAAQFQKTIDEIKSTDDWPSLQTKLLFKEYPDANSLADIPEHIRRDYNKTRVEAYYEHSLHSLLEDWPVLDTFVTARVRHEAKVFPSARERVVGAPTPRIGDTTKKLYEWFTMTPEDGLLLDERDKKELSPYALKWEKELHKMRRPWYTRRDLIKKAVENMLNEAKRNRPMVEAIDRVLRPQRTRAVSRATLRQEARDFNKVLGSTKAAAVRGFNEEKWRIFTMFDRLLSSFSGILKDHKKWQGLQAFGKDAEAVAKLLQKERHQAGFAAYVFRDLTWLTEDNGLHFDAKYLMLHNWAQGLWSEKNRLADYDQWRKVDRKQAKKRMYNSRGVHVKNTIAHYVARKHRAKARARRLDTIPEMGPGMHNYARLRNRELKRKYGEYIRAKFGLPR